MKWLFVVAVAVMATVARADTPVLTVYTYDSWASEWGSGPAIEKGFEAQCGCDLRYVALDSSISAFNRLRLEGTSSEADVFLGLDVNLAAEAAETGLFHPHERDLSGLSLPVAWDDPVFVPFDWGHFAFVYDREKLGTPPASFEDLMALGDDRKIVIQDPRSSTPGLGLLMWVRAAYGDRAPEIWEGLKPRILTVTKGWWEAYSLFLEGEADMVLSYVSSPAYHRIAEEKDTVEAAIFQEGHMVQVELAAVTAGSDVPDLAKAFLDYLVDAEAQSAIPTTNWMFPVSPDVTLPEEFAEPVPAQATLFFGPDEAGANRKAWIDEWLSVMGR